MRQLFLGRGAAEEMQKGMTGNTMLIAQPAPSYEQVLPSMDMLTGGLVVLFCRSVDDVSRAQMLVVNREAYRVLVAHRKRVCPVFANTAIDTEAINRLPESGVPQELAQSAQAMPETMSTKTTMHGPANRIPMFSRQASDGGSDSSGGEEGSGGGEQPPADTDAGSGGGEQPPADTDAQLAPAVELNEDETVIGMDEQSCPEPLRLFEAWTTTMDKLSAEAAKFAQAHAQQGSLDSAPAAAQRAAAEEVVRSTVAVDMIDIAKRMGKYKRLHSTHTTGGHTGGGAISTGERVRMVEMLVKP